jgi:hypothetical protein
MSAVEARTEVKPETQQAQSIDTKLEVVNVPVSDLDRAKWAGR